jgi:hypothetical protein
MERIGDRPWCHSKWLDRPTSILLRENRFKSLLSNQCDIGSLGQFCYGLTHVNLLFELMLVPH